MANGWGWGSGPSSCTRSLACDCQWSADSPVTVRGDGVAGEAAEGLVTGWTSPLMGMSPNVTLSQGFGIRQAWFESQLLLLIHLFVAWGGSLYLSSFSSVKLGRVLSSSRFPGVANTHPQSRPPGVLLRKQLCISGGRHPTPWLGQGMCALTRSGGDSHAPSHLRASPPGFL